MLLVQGETETERNRIQDLLPASTDVTVCQYLDSTVVRAGGFTSLENANAWAQYLTEVEGAQAFVARPAAPGEVTTVTPAPPPEPVVIPETTTPTAPQRWPMPPNFWERAMWCWSTMTTNRRSPSKCKTP
ncbi:MAG: hypothetical protein HC812_16255 [Leptolyngbya sp. RL_3_1]|nr:hypothetical protein [Leptolyngbya sp. RL_3_1]